MRHAARGAFGQILFGPYSSILSPANPSNAFMPSPVHHLLLFSYRRKAETFLGVLSFSAFLVRYSFDGPNKKYFSLVFY